MIDNDVDNAIASLLAASLTAIAGLTIVAGLQDNLPALQTPYLAVYSNIEKYEGRTHVFTLKTCVEYVSLSGVENKTTVHDTMSAVDATLGTPPTAPILALVVTTGLKYLSWEAVERSTQDIGDRRNNKREFIVFSEPV